jgi:hypothetical protein
MCQGAKGSLFQKFGLIACWLPGKRLFLVEKYLARARSSQTGADMEDWRWK